MKVRLNLNQADRIVCKSLKEEIKEIEKGFPKTWTTGTDTKKLLKSFREVLKYFEGNS